jgi:type II secretory pathway component GspD/PulD (secretin)
LGAVTYPQNGGRPVQSVQYRSSGVILDVTPPVRQDAIELAVLSQISDFAPTESGVNGSPTLTKRELITRVMLKDGDMVLIVGLDQDKGTESRSRFSFLPRVLSTLSKLGGNTQVVLILQVSKV